MKNIKMERAKFQIAGTILFVILALSILMAGFKVNSQEYSEPPAVEYGGNVQITTTYPEIGNTDSETKEAVKYAIYYDIPLSRELQDYIYELSVKYNVPYEVVIAVIQQESSYRPKVVGQAGELGYMQIHPINFERLEEELGITNFTDPEQNILCGVYMLSELYEEYDNMIDVLMCYSCGEAGAKRLWDAGVTETKYTKSVGAIINELKIAEVLEVE